MLDQFGVVDGYGLRQFDLDAGGRNAVLGNRGHQLLDETGHGKR